MTGFLDRPPSLAPKVPFGKRGAPKAPAAPSSAAVFAPKHGYASLQTDSGLARFLPATHAREAFVARYGWGVATFGTSLLVLVYRTYFWVLENPDFETGPMLATAGAALHAPGDMSLRVKLALLLGTLGGLSWIAAGIFRLPAVKISASGIEGFTVFGVRRFA